MNKTEGWESRLNAVIEQYLYAPFVWGQNDCLLFMADCGIAMSGEDIMAAWRGSYDSEETAYQMLDEHAEGSYAAAFEGMRRIQNTSFAQRGDLGLLTIDGRDFCGVVGMDGRHFLLRHIEGGLRRVPLKTATLWRIE